MNDRKIKRMSLAGVFTAAVFVFTAYLHIPAHTGYIHVGDAFIYLAACLLPLPYGVFVGACGALLADVLTGFALWAPGSVIVKSAAAFLFSSKGSKLLSGRNLLALLGASFFCVAGYYLYEGLITGNFLAPLAGVAGNVVQSLASSVLFAVLAFALDRWNAKERILK